VLAARTRANTLTHEQLSVDRREAAERKWRLADPDAKPVTAETKNFFLIGNVSQAEIDEAAQVAEAQAAAIGKLLRAPADQPLIKGRMVLFLFPTRYEYSEFGRMAEDRDLPAEWRGHWKFDTVDAYGVFVVPSEGGEYSLPGIIAQQVAAVYMASLPGGVPAWFSEGFGRASAARADGQSTRVRSWNERLNELLADGRAAGFINHKLGPQDDDIAAYGFVRDLISSNKFSSLIAALRGGEEFEAAFTRIFGPPQKATATWSRSVKPL
jgi:hypothetical protein